MAINNIKITTHDIFIEKDNKDKGGNLTIGTTTKANSNLIVHGNISGDKAAVGSGGLTVDGATGTTTLDVSGSTATNSLTVNTNTTNKGDLTVSGTTNTNTLKVSGSTTTQSLTVSGTTNTNTLSVTESTTTKTLNVTGTTNTNVLNAATIGVNTNGNLTIKGSNGTLTVEGTTNTTTLNSSGNVTIGSNDNSSSKLTIYGSADIRGTNGNLTVSKNISTDTLNVTGTTNTNTLSVNTINVTGNNKTVTLSAGTRTDISGNTFKCLNIDGEVNVGGQITVNGPIISAGENIEMGAIQANGNLTVGISDNPSYDLTVYGSANIIGSSGNSIVGSNGNLTVSKNITTNSLTVTANIGANEATIGTGGLTVGTNTNSANVNVFGNISINDNIVLRQNDSKTEIIVGSNDKPLKLFGSGDRPSYSKNGEGDINIALANDIYNPTITIKQDGAEKGSFTLNQSDGKTIELTDTTYTAGTGLTLSDGKFSVNTGFSTNGTNYQVTTDTSGNLYVNVPWTNVATTSSNGLMSSTDKSKLEGIADNANNYLLPVATSEALGGIKVGYNSNEQKYAVELDSENKAFVSVPWTDSNTTYTAGTGLELSGTTFNVKTNYNTNEKNYKVTTDTSGNLYVNVPWTDNDTKYTAGTGLTLSGGKFSVNIQDNLTSNSSTDVLSANQGRVLQSHIDGKSDIGHDHTTSEIRDFPTELRASNITMSSDGTTLTINYN